MRRSLAASAALFAFGAALCVAAPVRGEVKVEKVAYLNLPNCYKLSNGTVEVIVTTDVGPRIIRYSFPGDDNILAEMPDAVVKTDLGDWKPLGGHRLWVAPEAMPRTYAPDSAPVEFKQDGANTVRLTQAADAKTGIQKEMVVTLAPDGSEVTIQHRLTNKNFFAVDVASWGLSIMNGGGVTIIPQEPYISHDDVNGLLPSRPLIMWPYTDFSDPRWTLGKRYLRLKTDEALTEPQKAGVVNKVGWTGYSRNKTLFLKRMGYQDGLKYPDFGANCETYTAGSFMEIETLGPLRQIQWGETTEHTEKWRLFKNVDIGDTEATIDAALQPLIAGFPQIK
jgi:hypothetical protein